MSESQFLPSSEGPLASAYDADEASDCTYPSQLDLRDKLELLRWKYLEGGHRLPRYIPKIPHVDETKIISAVLDDELRYLEVGRQIAGTAKQIQTEYIYVKQKFDVLQQESNLLKWHLTSNSKVMKLKEGKLTSSEARSTALEKKLKSVRSETEIMMRERTALSLAYNQSVKELEDLNQEYEDSHEEMEQWLSRRGDYIADMTAERRKAGQERRLRNRQWKKLARACAVDKKWHVRIEAMKNADNMIFDAFESTNQLLEFDFEKAEDVTGPIRAIVTAQQQANDIKSFT